MRKKILILEDEQELAKLYEKFLKGYGYDIVLAFDGLQGLEKLKEMTPDLILLDLAMPHMSGIGFYEHVCGSDGKPKYPILILTGRVDLEDSCKSLHVKGLLPKPFKGSHLLKTMETILHQHARKSSVLIA